MKATHYSIATTDHKVRQSRDISRDMLVLLESFHARRDTLGREANELSMLIEVLAEISEQIHLVTINAALEADRAGESGKRFGVMLNEIKQLANQTSLVTKEIKNAIEPVCHSAEGSEDDIKRILEVIKSLDEIGAEISTAVE